MVSTSTYEYLANFQMKIILNDSHSHEVMRWGDAKYSVSEWVSQKNYYQFIPNSSSIVVGTMLLYMYVEWHVKKWLKIFYSTKFSRITKCNKNDAFVSNLEITYFSEWYYHEFGWSTTRLEQLINIFERFFLFFFDNYD